MLLQPIPGPTRAPTGQQSLTTPFKLHYKAFQKICVEVSTALAASSAPNQVPVKALALAVL